MSWRFAFHPTPNRSTTAKAGGDERMAKGNPNPSPGTRFQVGNKANPGGKTPELKKIEAEAGLMAAKIRLLALSAMTEKLAKIKDNPDAKPEDVLAIVTGDNLRLFKDSEDRAHGTPKQSVEHGGTGENGEIVFRTVYEGK